MPEVDRFCEACHMITKHKAEPFYAPRAAPTSTKLVDLTGRSDEPTTGQGMPLNQAICYTCIRCGLNTTEVGQVQRKEQQDPFAALKAGRD